MIVMSEFFAMGGYGVYIWSAFGISAAILAAVAVQSHRQLKSVEKEFSLLTTNEAAGVDADPPAPGLSPMEGKSNEAQT